MAFEGSTFKKKIGVDLFTVVAVNPSIDGIRKIRNWGEDKEVKAPVYQKEKEGVAGINLAFYVKGANTGINIRYFTLWNIESFSSRTNKFEFIDKFGRTNWCESKEKLVNTDKFDVKSARLAFKGESDLTMFIKMWLGIKKEQEARLGDVRKIIEGDLAELDGYIKRYANYQLCMLAYVDERGYVSLWSSDYGYPSSFGNEAIWNSKIEYHSKNDFRKLKAKQYSIKITEVQDEVMDEDKPEVQPETGGYYPKPEPKSDVPTTPADSLPF